MGEVCVCMCGRNFRILRQVLHAQRGVSAESKVTMLNSQRHRKDACDDKPHRVRDHRTAAEVVGTRRPSATQNNHNVMVNVGWCFLSNDGKTLTDYLFNTCVNVSTNDIYTL